MSDIGQLSWSEIDASNTSAPPTGWPAGMFPNLVEPTAQAMMGAIKRFYGQVNPSYKSTGAAGLYVVTPTVAPAAYVQGMILSFKTDKASAGADILNWGGLGPLTVFKLNSNSDFVPLSAGDLTNNQQIIVAYDGGLPGFQLLTPIISNPFPSSMISPFAGVAAPAGWLLCDGSPVSRTTYASLFAVIGINYGAGDGSTTFNIPDLRGRFVAGRDPGDSTGRLTQPGGNNGVSAGTIGNTGGEQTHAQTTAELAQHTHVDNGHTHGAPGGQSLLTTGNGISFTGGGASAFAISGATTAGNANIQNAGGGAAFNIVPPAIILTYIIKT